MYTSSRTLALLLIVASCTVCAFGQITATQRAASQLVREVVQNELSERLHHGRWMYRLEKQEAGQYVTEEQVETESGPIFRLMAINSRPLTPIERQSDNARLERLLRDPSQQKRLKKDAEDDERKLQELMRILPGAYVYDFDGTEGNAVRLRFRPNPSYEALTYEARVAQKMSGTLLIDRTQKRLLRISGMISEPVNFGYGLLGRVDKGGSIEIVRMQVSPTQWKTSLMKIQLAGRVAIFKTIRKQEFQQRSDFHPVAEALTLTQARDLLMR